MAKNSNGESAFDPDNLYLSPKEQDLLLTALNSNKPNMPNSARSSTLNLARPSNNASANSGQQYQQRSQSATFGNFDPYTSPIQQTPGSATMSNGFNDSPYLDNYDLDDGNFDWDNSGPDMIGSLPTGDYNGEEDTEHHDKRKSPEDDPDEDEEEGGGKRREGDDKSSKKPGRKPMTSEPTSKRKAQNRAAQRAFRERKERHLKELETKVDDLEKASESANHENGRLRAQVERLQSELKEYRKRMNARNVNGIARTPSQTSASKSAYDIGNNFQFEFPTFGPANVSTPNLTSSKRGSNGISPRQNSTENKNRNGQMTDSPISISSPNKADQQSFATFNNGLQELSGLYNPPSLQNIGRSASGSYLSHSGNKNTANNQNQQRASVSVESSNNTALHKNSSSGISEYNTASPSASSVSQNGGLISSCGTTPEPSADSPGQFESSDGTITMNNAFGMPDFSAKTPDIFFQGQGFDWMAQQNGGNFDPVLFGDYRESQESIMNADLGDFFSDAFDGVPDFANPANLMLEPSLPPKKDIIKDLEEKQHGKEPEPAVTDKPKQFLTCNMLWDRVQRSEKVQSGEADMDDLCTQLKAKARCSGSGAVIDQQDVDAILGPAPGDQHDFLKMFR